ncbi:MAG: twin-arginine translocase TatA/TatE family subunit [Candidatus Eremiobacteraeota bacterium]|nr:twin-arginine translocase TatA/TatE family subunit [Candidatus Eremiobacteraeota bacterium]
MLSVTEMAVLGVLALVFFGPDRLPGVMRKAGRIMRDVQNTSQSFIREMERAADEHDPERRPPPESPPPGPANL